MASAPLLRLRSIARGLLPAVPSCVSGSAAGSTASGSPSSAASRRAAVCARVEGSGLANSGQPDRRIVGQRGRDLRRAHHRLAGSNASMMRSTRNCCSVSKRSEVELSQAGRRRGPPPRDAIRPPCEWRSSRRPVAATSAPGGRTLPAAVSASARSQQAPFPPAPPSRQTPIRPHSLQERKQVFSALLRLRQQQLPNAGRVERLPLGAGPAHGIEIFSSSDLRGIRRGLRKTSTRRRRMQNCDGSTPPTSIVSWSSDSSVRKPATVGHCRC